MDTTIPIPSRRRATLAIVAVALLLIGAALFFKLHSPNSLSTERDLLGRLPNEPNAVLSIDFAALRRAGLLTERTAPLEPDYRAFLTGTGFDYRRDLDLVVASLSSRANYFIARGRFDWPKLRSYAESQGGSCYDQLCRAPGSTPERHISFIPLSSNIIGLAVSPDDLAATRFTKQTQIVSAALPTAPVWLSVPGAALARPGALPEGLRVALSGLLDADRLLLTAGADNGGIALHLEASCKTIDAARTLESQLRSTAADLKEASRQDATRKNEPTEKSLSGILSTGSFARDARTVTGKWRLSPSLIQELTAGI